MGAAALSNKLFCRFHRIEVLGALVSVLSTWLVTGILLWEAVDRIRNPIDVNGKCKLHLFSLCLVSTCPAVISCHVALGFLDEVILIIIII